MLVVYERLNALNEERLRARYVRSLLAALIASPNSPEWFTALKREAFESHRSKSIRLTLDHRDPALSPLLAELEPLSHAQRVLQIKRVLRKACTKTPETVEPSSYAMQAVSYSPAPSQSDTAQVEVPAKPTAEEDAVARSRILRGSLSPFRPEKSSPIETVNELQTP